MLLSSTKSTLPPSPTSTLPSFTKASPHSKKLARKCIPWKSRSKRGASIIKVSSSFSSSSSPASENRTAVVVPSTSQPQEADAAAIVRRFYGGINSRDLASVELLIAEKCVYEDLVFPRPFIGRKVAYLFLPSYAHAAHAILEFFKKFTDATSKDLQFVIDDISTEDSSAVGVTWHLEWKGKAFPFSKGCSFYRLKMVDGKRQIIYGRDVAEPSIKPGEAVLGVIRAVTWLLQQFPQLADKL